MRPHRKLRPLEDREPWEAKWFEVFRKSLGESNYSGLFAWPSLMRDQSVVIPCDLELTIADLRRTADALEIADAVTRLWLKGGPVK